MVTTTDSKKPVLSPFDILNSQLEKVESVDVLSVPIRKVFDDIPKPTELLPLEPNNHNQKIVVKTVANRKGYLPKEEFVIYLNRLISEKRPIKSLKFDIEESSGDEEVARLINDSKLLSVVEKQDLLKIIGQESLLTGEGESLDKEIPVARQYYISLLAPYVRKNRIDKASYKKLMADFGVEKEVPEKIEPKDLVVAKEEYTTLKSRKNIAEESNGIDFLLSEAELFSSELLKTTNPESVHLPEKLFSVWERSENSKAIKFLLEDESFSSGGGEEIQKFEGLRQEEAKKAENPPVENSSIQKEIYGIKSASPKVEEFPSEFEGNRVLVTRENGENTAKIKVFLNDKEIAVGELTKKGMKIKIKPEYKTGWFFEDSLEERVFKKKALPFIKKLEY